MGGRVAAVYDGQTYLGLVSLEDISEAFLVASFLQRGGPGATPSETDRTGEVVV